MNENSNNNAENGIEAEEIKLPPVPKPGPKPEMVQIPKEQFLQFMDKLKSYESDIHTLVSTLMQFSGMFNGKGGMLSIMTQLPKLINDPQIIEQFKNLTPILEKYGKAESE